jgi:hypothetical protein
MGRCGGLRANGTTGSWALEGEATAAQQVEGGRGASRRPLHDWSQRQSVVLVAVVVVVVVDDV